MSGGFLWIVKKVALMRIPTKVTGDSGEHDRLQGGGDAGRYFLHQAVTMGQVFAFFFRIESPVSGSRWAL